MKKLNSLNLGKGLTRTEMKNISGGLLPGGGGGELGACAYAQAQFCPDSANPCIDTRGDKAVCNRCCIA